ncbi:unnamed protein product [Rodentolepis nana]|uniref:Pkinase_fungal domain-containing protein n=1 Tax=Rodentolepis nana TaxID=102285 RepID=A0A0R3T4J1_RODNA|nr:unnamed protein product [Rodentolepis nana]
MALSPSQRPSDTSSIPTMKTCIVLIALDENLRRSRVDGVPTAWNHFYEMRALQIFYDACYKIGGSILVYKMSNVCKEGMLVSFNVCNSNN